MIKPMGIFNPLGNKKITQVISGHLKQRPKMSTVTMQFTVDQIERMEKEALELDVARNKYIGIVLEHYWKCKK